MACIDALEQDAAKNVWVGTSIRTGETRVFNTLTDYKNYAKTLGVDCPEATPQYNRKYVKGQNTTETGFMEFAPRDPVAQAKYDAMSDTWEGVESSTAAVARGDYSLDSAASTRKQLRAAGRVPLSEENKGVPILAPTKPIVSSNK
jgi:hypothetical protein